MTTLNPDLILKPNRMIHADYAHIRGIYGSGVGVAVLDTGIEPRADFVRMSLPSHTSYPDIQKSRILCFQDFVNHRRLPYDDSGHGSHICGKIASCMPISSDGTEYLGIAPNCNLIILKILDRNGDASIQTFLTALRWIHLNYRTYHIRIVNISIGANHPSDSADAKLLVDAVDDLWEEGLVVCVSAGNNGPTPSSITVPGNSCKVITVGASDDQTFVQTSHPRYSGRGPADCQNVKPELVAPGSQIISCSPFRQGYSVKTGTSMSTALVSGAIALLLEQEPDLTNEAVKQRLQKCARRLNLPHFQQGFGLLDIQRLLFNSHD
jgi:serine protease AprX